MALGRTSTTLSARIWGKRSCPVGRSLLGSEGQFSSLPAAHHVLLLWGPETHGGLPSPLEACL